MSQISIPSDFYQAASPVIVLCVFGLIAMLFAASRTNHERVNAVTIGCTYGGIILALLCSIGLHGFVNEAGEGRDYLHGALLAEGLSLFGQQLILGIALAITVLFHGTALRNAFFKPESQSVFFFVLAGMLVMVSSVDLVTLFVGLEMASIGTYAMVGYLHTSQAAKEGAAKYLVLGAFATAFLLFGIGLLYAATGSLSLEGIAQSLRSASVDNIWVKFGIGLCLVGLGFKFSLAPFHLWTPDAYEAAPTGVTALMATATKAMILIVLLRFLGNGVAAFNHQWSAALVLCAALSVLFGNVMALVQSSVKRMLAYSSIAHGGYMAIALCSLGIGQVPVSAVLFYIVAYVTASLGAFGILMWLETEESSNLRLDDLSGLGKRFPWTAAALSLFMVSMAGLPPTAGFLGKFFVFSAAVKRELIGLVIVGIIGAMVSLYYYFRIMVRMYMHDPVPYAVSIKPPRSKYVLAVVTIMGAVTVLLGTIFPNTVVEKLDRFAHVGRKNSTSE